MAISYKGVTKIDASAGDGSDAAVTIPADSTIAVIMLVCWDSGGSGTPLANVVVDSQNDTTVYSVDIGASDEPSIYLGWAKDFSTGSSKTVSWTWTADEAITNGGIMYITWWDGVDTTTPFSDDSYDRAANLLAVSTSVTTAANEVVVVHTQKFDTAAAVELTVDGSPTITSIYDNETDRNERVDLDYFTRTQATHTLDVEEENYSSVIAAVLAEASSSSVAPIAGRHMLNMMSN
jgi:hypothetical protein